LNVGTGNFTVEFYINPESVASGYSRNAIFSMTEATQSTGISLQLQGATQGAGGLSVNICGVTIINYTTAIPTNQWTHVAVVRSGTGTNDVKLYINGINVASGTSAANITNATYNIGALKAINSLFDDFFTGYISHLRVTKGIARPVSEFSHAAHDILGHLKSATENLALRMGSESAITLGGTSAGNLQSHTTGQTTADDFNSGTTKSLGANFPKGSKAFYCMKTEISQQQYVNFLNTLTRAQQNARTATALGAGTTSVTNRYVMSNTSTISNRNGIRCDASIHTSDPIAFYCDFNGNGTGGEAGDGGWIACNFLSWADGAAYMDWAGLRPMSELEFEKAARGSRVNATGEYAWGSTSVTAAATLNNSGAHDEDVTTGSAIYGNSAIGGPLRTGAFAKSGTARAASGSSLYGILDLSGNVEERTVSLGLDSGRVFTGAHGNGALAASGNADVTAWPTFTANGAGFRGGAWNTVLARLRSSDRMRANVTDATRAAGYGFRGVRTVQCTAPTASITLSGTQLFNFTNPNQTYTASGGTDYLWSISPDFALSSGQGTNSINTIGPNSSALGVIYCADVNSCGTGPETRLDLFSVASSWPTILASGGTITSFIGDGTNGSNGVAYVVHTFTSGSSTFSAFPGLAVDYLIVGGGAAAAGGTMNVTFNMGGGAGEVLSNSATLTSSSLSVTVGAAGIGIAPNGGNSSLGSWTANGGTIGGGYNGGTSGSGFVGGNFVGGCGTAGAGGGGATGTGSNNSCQTPGAGGPGFSSSISGSSQTFGIGGTGGCGTCPNSSHQVANTGNGGSGNQGNGGSGLVIVRYAMP
jgi:formylglycine-generating enzyme required for sulfatase activity